MSGTAETRRRTADGTADRRPLADRQVPKLPRF